MLPATAVITHCHGSIARCSSTTETTCRVLLVTSSQISPRVAHTMRCDSHRSSGHPAPPTTTRDTTAADAPPRPLDQPTHRGPAAT